VAQCAKGHKGCTCSMMCCSVTDERAEQIKADAQSGRNWAEETAYGAACVCGAGLRTLTAALALRGVHGVPTGLCDRHPGGHVLRKEGGW
jgi:hypothetical protein